MIILLALIFGFLTGVLVNLIADYLPARQHHFQARRNPFVSPDVVPQKPRFLPHRADGTLWPLPLWSGLIAALTRTPVFDPPRRLRRLSVEIGLAFAFPWIVSEYGQGHSLPFLLFYAAILALVVVIDMEHRWIMWEIIVPGAIAALAEAILVARINLQDALRGGLYGLLILFALYLGGFLFGGLMQLLTGRRIGRTILGIGDVRMGLLCGLIVGWQGITSALFIMVFSGAIAALIFMANKSMRMRRYRAFSAIPYGPYIVIGTAITLYLPWIAANVLLLIMRHR